MRDTGSLSLLSLSREFLDDNAAKQHVDVSLYRLWERIRFHGRELDAQTESYVKADEVCVAIDQ